MRLDVAPFDSGQSPELHVVTILENEAMDERSQIERFLDGSPHAVVGASRDREKYGNKVLRAFMQHSRKAFPVNPTADEVEGLTAYPNLSALPEPVYGVSVITPPHATERVIEEAGKLGISHVWLQPGAESPRAVARAKELGIELIAGGPCILVALRYHE
ncbi:MAG: CoA-binding protein [Planctomycetales bacterium]|nr:CoA-binding protein [Planctomycetales bacterium]